MPDQKTKNPWLIILIILLLTILTIIGLSFYLKNIVKGENFSNIFKTTTENAQNGLVKDRLDGTQVPTDIASRNPLAIIVENHPDARPQSGLDQASIVYEALTEGGITRFLAIYGPRDSDKVGPVRSARTYFIDFLSEYNAYFAHVGGNLDALDMIKADSIFDLDQFGIGEPTYWREPQTGLAIEHTMYTSTKLLYAAAAAKNWLSSKNVQALNFRQSAPNNNLSQSIDINFSTPEYEVTWNYDPESDTYLRTMAGLPHKDAITGKNLAAANIIVQEVNHWSAPTTIGEDGFAMQTTGSGNAKIFIEGKEIDGTWSKKSRTDRTLFFDQSGKAIEFIPGVFWYEIVPPEVFTSIKVS
jgi:hypothetical protein